MKIAGNQLIDSVRALLRDTLMPELQSDIARARLRQIMATLRDVDWDEAPFTLLHENLILESLLRQWDGDAHPAQAPSATSFSAAAAINQDLRRKIAHHLANANDGWTQAHAKAARVLADCAHRRAQKRQAPSPD